MWKVGIPSDLSASMGALISKAHLEKVSKSLQSKLQEEFLFGEKLSTGYHTHPCFEILLIATLFLKNCDPWKMVSGYNLKMSKNVRFEYADVVQVKVVST